MKVLVQLPYSPWSEKARWSLDHHGVSYRAIEHVPLVFEPLLRLAVRELRKPLSVPILFDGPLVLRDSCAIGQHADAIGSAEPLFGRGRAAEVLALNELSEQIMCAGRARATARLLEDPEALAELLPVPLRQLPSVMVPAARLGTRFVIRKHVCGALTKAQGQAQLFGLLTTLQKRLGGAEHAAGHSFSFADIALSCALGFIKPHERMPLGPASTRAFSEPELAHNFSDLLSWRDSTVERFR